ncbi:hypothetical protein M3Y98_00113100 [Aphelenchoides besseyi]|nr:hypothetical protein M3Y98_00113100 [Aphelenchoides besseyi]
MTSSSSIGSSSFYSSSTANITTPSALNLTTKFRLNFLIYRFCRLNLTALSSWNTTDVSALVTQIGNQMNLTDVELNQLRSLVADANLSASDVRTVLSSCQRSKWNPWTKRPRPDKSLENDFHFPAGDNPGDGSWSDDFQGPPRNIPPPFPSFTFPWLPQSVIQVKRMILVIFHLITIRGPGILILDTMDRDQTYILIMIITMAIITMAIIHGGVGIRTTVRQLDQECKIEFADDDGWSNRDRRIWRWVVLAVCGGFILLLALAILCAALYRPTVHRRIIVTPYNNQIYTKDGRNDALPPVPVSPMQSYPNVRY